MNKIKLNPGGASLLASLLMLAGCTTTGELDFDRIARGAREAARLGTQEAVRDHPDWEAAFVQARDQLDAIAARDRLTPTDLLDAIDGLPVSELRSDTVKLAITATRLIISIAGWSDVEIVRTAQVRPVVLALAEGITAGLPSRPPPTGAEAVRALRAGPARYYQSK